MFDGTLGEWDTDPIDLELKPNFKSVNIKYYPVPRTNKETFRKELQFLVEVRALNPVQKSQYGTPTFIIPNK